ncbi:hypothetical protein [Chroococcidiopsis sp. TS-821]|uniref:hypothetical protein n=1 Tax=Chroococcidiopsis sp. TS-821 TaxID=1378066 RepID=UPI00143DF483|nr:hypothetical protein [Chroococcidiopsis sp. TS-821]
MRSHVAMIQTLPERMSFAEFVEWYPDNGRRYELHNEIVIETQPLCFKPQKCRGIVGDR